MARSACRFKLEEAAFFLSKIDEHYYDYLNTGSFVPLGYYLSAFASAARSVPWVMRAEYHGVSGWRDWYDDQLPPYHSDRELLRGFRAFRNTTQKVRQPQYSISYFASDPEGGRPPEPDPWGDRKPLPSRFSVKLEPVDGDGNKKQVYQAELTAFDVELPELGKGSLLTAARRYLRLLEKLVNDCEARFGEPSAASYTSAPDARHTDDA